MERVVRIRASVVEAMLRQARAELPLECCGLLGGKQGIISEIFPATNALRSATAFEIAPAELFRHFRSMREQKLDHLGIYHSHPAGPAAPSPRDIEQAYYPGLAYFVLCPQDANPVRSFVIAAGLVEELRIEAVEE
jgi:proteasome lid subunit RPN8/RPN11